MYHSQITFTFDTICPWTYIAKKRLGKALDEIAASPAGKDVSFTLVFKPYQLYPAFSSEPQDKRHWYVTEKHDASDVKQSVYEATMSELGAAVGINFSWGGTMSNTFNAHRVIQHFQEAKGAETANRLVEALYSRYFEKEQDQGAKGVLLEACVEAGIPEAEAREVIEDETEGKIEVKNMIRMSSMDGVDAVPHIMFEGRRRDLTLIGAKEVGEYVKTLQSIIKESK
ncbi:DSBA-like thioredoxin domain-containing protein [Colletotrichum karsti]|uniref:DSBA-like thioredoxin domain-containing protein n=1 Tax=Colletotrichum karsti TaxID=1095194 RepID=A0A9P6LQL6_9PEZI|nr:DSBA-like thioredoxin domain-containing protein [Colletotrichum karsti]KAF9880862.1 DSBA-like thioredoxin domain-containing protein [Colletotrichum karsti]